MRFVRQGGWLLASVAALVWSTELGASESPKEPDNVAVLPSSSLPRRHDQRSLRFEGPEPTQRHPRVSLAAEPLFATFRAAFIGRPSDRPLRGGGVALDLDVRLHGPW